MPGHTSHPHLYTYSAVNACGSIVKGRIAARSFTQARQKLLDREIFLVELCRRESRKMVKVSENLIAHFFQQLAQLLESGLDLGACFAVLKTTDMPRVLRDWALRIDQRVHEGHLLSAAFRDDGRCGTAQCALIEAGELRGTLAQGLRSAAQLMQDRIDLRRSLEAKLAYPALLVVLCLSIFLLFIFAIAPQLEPALQMGNLEHRVHWMFAFSAWARQRGQSALAWFAACMVCTTWLVRGPLARAWLSRFVLRLPFVGSCIYSGNLYWFFRVLAQLLEGKIELARALPIAVNATQNPSLAQRLAKPLKRIENGQTLSSAMQESGLLPQVPLQLLVVGEKAGTLATATSNVARFFQHRRDKLLKGLLSALQPGLLLLIGALIAFVGQLVLRPLMTLEVAP